MSEIIDISLLKPFTNHPFRKLDGEKLDELADSISRVGLITPILIRPIEKDGYKYEIVAGHNRVNAMLLLGYNQIAADIRELSDEVATVMMVDSNLQQRDDILPSEKAWAYRMKYEALKSQGKRNDLTSSQVGTKLRADEIIAQNGPDSRNQIQRYIRLTYLIKPLLNLVDEGKLKFNPAVEISYLSEARQIDLAERMEFHDCYNISLESAIRIKEIEKYGFLSIDKIDHYCFEHQESPKENIKIPASRINMYFDKDASPKEKEDTIVKALEMYCKLIKRAHYRDHRDMEVI